MHYVYMLGNKNGNYHYIGITRDLKARFREHTSGRVDSTRPYRPLRLVYYEAYSDMRDAVRREHSLKHSGAAIGHLKKRLTNSLS